MSENKRIYCIICNNEIQRDYSFDIINSATTFYTNGHYGSTFYDSMDGKEIVITICDLCLAEKSQYIYEIEENQSNSKNRIFKVYEEGTTENTKKWIENNYRYHTIHQNIPFTLRDKTELIFKKYNEENPEHITATLLKDNEEITLSNKETFITRNGSECIIEIGDILNIDPKISWNPKEKLFFISNRPV